MRLSRSGRALEEDVQAVCAGIFTPFRGDGEDPFHVGRRFNIERCNIDLLTRTSPDDFGAGPVLSKETLCLEKLFDIPDELFFRHVFRREVRRILQGGSNSTRIDRVLPREPLQIVAREIPGQAEFPSGRFPDHETVFRG